VILRLAALVLVLAAAPTAPADAQGAHRFALPNGVLVRAPVQSITEMRFNDVVQQSLDLSCGAAAMATVLTYFYDMDVSEGEIIDAVFEASTPETRASIANAGFSLLELKNHYERMGFVAGGFRVPGVADLASLSVPAISLVNVRGYNHFVVIKRLEGDHVLVADPAFGNLRIHKDTFASQWSHVILVAVREGGEIRQAFFEDQTVRARPLELLSLDISPWSAAIQDANEF